MTDLNRCPAGCPYITNTLHPCPHCGAEVGKAPPPTPALEVAHLLERLRPDLEAAVVGMDAAAPLLGAAPAEQRYIAHVGALMGMCTAELLRLGVSAERLRGAHEDAVRRAVRDGLAPEAAPDKEGEPN